LRDTIIGIGLQHRQQLSIGHNVASFTVLCRPRRRSGRQAVPSATTPGFRFGVVVRGVSVGRKRKVGAGAVVTPPVPDGQTVNGFPARLTATKSNELRADMKFVMVAAATQASAAMSGRRQERPRSVTAHRRAGRTGHETTVLFLAKSPAEAGRATWSDYGCFRYTSFVHVGWRRQWPVPAVFSDMVNDIGSFPILPHLRGKATSRYRPRASGHCRFDIAVPARRGLAYAWRHVVCDRPRAGKTMGRLYLSWRDGWSVPIRLMVCTKRRIALVFGCFAECATAVAVATNGVISPPRSRTRHMIECR